MWHLTPSRVAVTRASTAVCCTQFDIDGPFLYSDGMCCAYGDGSYTILVDGDTQPLLVTSELLLQSVSVHLLTPAFS